MGQLLSNTLKIPNSSQASESARLLLKNHPHHSNKNKVYTSSSRNKVSMSSVASTAEISPEHSPVPTDNHTANSSRDKLHQDGSGGIHALFVGSFANWALLSFNDDDADHTAKAEDQRPNRSRTTDSRQLRLDQSPTRGVPATNSGTSTTRSQPVKCPPRRRPTADDDDYHFSSTGQQQGDHEDDAQYLRRLYEMRTWDMYVRITEARKRQRNRVPADTYVQRHQSQHATQDDLQYETQTERASSPSHVMIFSCDME